MATISEALAIAVEHHQAGRLAEAEQIYRQILAAEPSQADAIHLLGLMAHQVGQHQVAVECIGRAIALRGGEAAFHNNLGGAYRALGRTAEAVACYRRAVELQPHNADAQSNLGVALNDQGKLDEAVACYRRALELNPEVAAAHCNLGNALRHLGRLEEAVACCRRALQLKPEFAEAHSNLGNALQDQGKLDQAVLSFHRAVELKPDFAEAHSNLGNAWQDQGKLDQAVLAFHRALELKPDCAEAHNNLGNVLKDQGKLDAAIACYRRALELKPQLAAAHNNLGSALRSLGQIDEAAACYRRALELMPTHAEVHRNLGIVLHDQGKLAEALVCYRRALQLGPDDADAHWGLGCALLALGDFEHGWSELAWRWRAKGFAKAMGRPVPFRQPAWEGEPLAGRTCLLYSEQGFGDTIHFIRYAALLKQRGGRVIVECQPPLLRLLAGCAGIDRLVGRGDDLPAFDVHAPLVDVPGIVKTTLATIPAHIPYLFAEPPLEEQWRRKMAALEGFRVGINWRARPAPGAVGQRGIPVEHFAALAAIPAVQLVNLQKGEGPPEERAAAARLSLWDPGPELDREAAFVDTAACMKSLDLVISSDSAVAHLAGALGVPVWVAVPFSSEWRWLLDRTDSPWYPTLRLFRQRSPGDWSGVFAEIASALRERIAQGPCEEATTRPGGITQDSRG